MISERSFEDRWQGALRAQVLHIAREGDQDDDQMPLSRLGLACERRADLVLIALSGELDVYTAHDFWERTRHYDPAEVQMVIDLGEVTLIDAAGLGALVSLCNAARRDRARIGVVCPQRRLQRVSWATGLRSAFVLGPDLATVAADLAAPADPT